MHDVVTNAARSGEPLVPEIRHMFENGPPPAIGVPEYCNNTLKLQEYRARYQTYWNSTAEKTGTGESSASDVLM